uniref:Uncharacterized protein n=4 Tax=Aegilops tauschii subsp. strangulata TaxID=200361 RepID=A0A453SG97_AEGTS
SWPRPWLGRAKSPSHRRTTRRRGRPQPAHHRARTSARSRASTRALRSATPAPQRAPPSALRRLRRSARRPPLPNRRPRGHALRRLRRLPRAAGRRRWSLPRGGLHRLPHAFRDPPHPLREAPSAREDFDAWLADNLLQVLQEVQMCVSRTHGSIGLRTTHPFTNSISVILNKVSMIPPSLIFLIDL